MILDAETPSPTNNVNVNENENEIGQSSTASAFSSTQKLKAADENKLDESSPSMDGMFGMSAYSLSMVALSLLVLLCAVCGAFTIVYIGKSKELRAIKEELNTMKNEGILPKSCKNGRSKSQHHGLRPKSKNKNHCKQPQSVDNLNLANLRFPVESESQHLKLHRVVSQPLSDTLSGVITHFGPQLVGTNSIEMRVMSSPSAQTPDDPQSDDDEEDHNEMYDDSLALQATPMTPDIAQQSDEHEDDDEETLKHATTDSIDEIWKNPGNADGNGAFKMLHENTLDALDTSGGHHHSE